MEHTTTSEYRDFFAAVEPIRMRDPLATLFGAFKGENDIIEYSFTDVIKAAGHACPTISMTYVACKYVVKALFPDGIGQRGDMSVIVHGEKDDGSYGVMAQVFSLITGACPETGFKGMGGLHRRNNLLRYGKQMDKDHVQFTVRRNDTKAQCMVSLNPQALPSHAPDKARRLADLLTPNIWEIAGANERTEFKNLWMEQIQKIVSEEKDRPLWLNIKTKEVYDAKIT
ncbi:hypothetical protein QA601_02570 [Chitinispirillales bacterium ANBcel5]|uniref:hypothetical protein n=1 Tax=Cellulosispirillum alkaliphilum TaxID=3039283 RepID=UPI002A5766E8|nr:hypothetical protein [Chitinispirillales bacterium ANBcel5]